MYTDFGYMEEGKLGKPYDLKLMARLGGFLKPYWSLMALSLLFVLIMAGLDLLIPYLTKEAIDRYIVVSAREVVLREDGSPGGAPLLGSIWSEAHSEKREREISSPIGCFAIHGSKRNGPFSKIWSPLGKSILPIYSPETRGGRSIKKISLLF